MNTAKAAIEAEHLNLVRRVFKALPDPLPDAKAIRAAFEADPEYEVLSGRSADKVMKLIVSRCLQNHWTIPPAIRDLEHWPTLYVKWHWFCSDRLPLAGEKSVPRQWAGRAKAEVQQTSPLLRAPRKRKPSRNYWFDHAPFRMQFGNQTCGMSWDKRDFAASRTFLLLDGERIRIGIVPRTSRFCPYTIPDPELGEATYRLYEETEGRPPALREVAKARIDIPARRGLLLLFELDGRGLRGKSNLNALYLRALFSDENLRDPVLRLGRSVEFHVRKGTDIPRDGKPEQFRQRFTEDRLFATFRLTINAHLVAIGAKPQAFGSFAKYVAANPTSKVIDVPSAPPQTDTGRFVGALARRVIAEDACVLFAPGAPKRLLAAVRDKFEYVVLKDRAPTADGGVLRGYQLADRLFVGDREKADGELRARDEALRQREAEDAARREKAARKAANRAHAEELRRIAAQRRSAVPPDFSAPPFQVGKSLFNVEFKTSDNVRHSVKCRADSRDEMFAKARSVGVRPSRVTCLDSAPDDSTTIAERLRRLDALKDQGLVSETEHAAQRVRILGEL